MEKYKVIDSLEVDNKTYEAFRMLRTTLESRAKDMKVITFIGADKGTGSSFVAYNTAKTFAALGIKCLYINVRINVSDSKAPYSIEGSYKTLSDYILGHSGLNEILVQGKTENLSIIDSGDKSETLIEVSMNNRYNDLLSEVKKQFEYIIVDVPNLEVSSDSMICASSGDGVVIVVERGCNPYKDVQKVRRVLELSHCNILGVVLNK